MRTNSRKRLSVVLAVVCCLTLLVGSFAFFTDRATVDATATAGSLAVGLSEGDAAISDQLLLGGSDGIENYDELDNWNPGDSVTFSYTVSNDGNKAIRAEETLTLTVTGKGGEYGDFVEEDGSMFTIQGSDGTVIEPTSADLADNVWTLVYNLDEFALSAADGEKLASSASVQAAATNGMNAVDATAAEALRTFTLAFNGDATNEYQDAEIGIVVHVDSIQYANTRGENGVAANGISEYVTSDDQMEVVYTDDAGAAA